MADPLDVPRPAEPGAVRLRGSRARAWRGDARVGAAVLACVARRGGRRVVPRGHRAVDRRAEACGLSATGSRRCSGAVELASGSTTRPSMHDLDDHRGAIVVDVVGAVRAPGVVSLPASAACHRRDPRPRAVRAPGADLARLNLAAKLADGDADRGAAWSVSRRRAVDPSAVSGAAARGRRRGTGARRRRPPRPSTSTPRPLRAARDAAGHRADAGRRDRAGTRAQRPVPQRRRPQPGARHRRRAPRAAPRPRDRLT